MKSLARITLILRHLSAHDSSFHKAKKAAEFALYDAIRNQLITANEVDRVAVLIKPAIERMNSDDLATDVRDVISATLVGLVGKSFVCYDHFNAILKKMPKARVTPRSNKDTKAVPVTKITLKHAFIDLLGTVIHHRTGRALALMESFIHGLHQAGWKINILTSYSHDQATRLVRPLKLPDDLRIVSSAGTTKGIVVSKMVRDLGEGEYIYMDDKPENLSSVRNSCGDRVRTIGFVGSHKYTPKLSDWCFHNGVELALSVSDLCEGLQVDCDAYSILVGSAERFTEDELFLLVPGLDHPRSAFGETFWLDHRAVLCELLDHRRIVNFLQLWANIAWITCGECLLKAMVESVIKFLGLDRIKVLGKAYKYDEYLTAMRQFAELQRDINFMSAFEQAFACAEDGVRSIGVEAERCRISGRSIDPYRLDFARESIRKCLIE